MGDFVVNPLYNLRKTVVEYKDVGIIIPLHLLLLILLLKSGSK